MSTAKPSLKLTMTPDTVIWPETHYVFVEKVGPFQDTAQKAGRELHTLTPAIAGHNQITGYTSLYKIGPQLYRAGVSVASAPGNLPEGVRYTKFPGGKYSRFILTGPYANLPEACGRVFQMVADQKIP